MHYGIKQNQSLTRVHYLGLLPEFHTVFPSTPLDNDSYRYVRRSPRSDTLSGADHRWDPYMGLKQLLSIEQYDPMGRHDIW